MYETLICRAVLIFVIIFGEKHMWAAQGVAEKTFLDSLP